MELQDTGWSYRIQDTVVGYRIELQDTGQSCIIQETVVGYMTVLQDTAWDAVGLSFSLQWYRVAGYI